MTDNGAPVNLYGCHSGAAQKWVPGPYPGTLQNPNSGRCLTVPSGSNVPGTHLIISDCLDNSSQYWQAPTATTALVGGFSSATYPVVDSPGGINGDGYPDLIITDNNHSLVQYLGTAPEAGLPRFGDIRVLDTPKPASYNINSAANPNRCLDNSGASNGTNLRFYDCWAGANQKFTFGSDGTLRTSGRCVATKNNATSSGTQVVITDCVGATGQVWTLRADGSIYNPTADRCLDLPGAIDANGTVLAIGECLPDHANQRWTMYPNNT